MHRSPEHMAEMLAARAPLTDPRDGRLLQQIRHAWYGENTDVLSMTKLLAWAYPTLPKVGIVRRKWHYEMLNSGIAEGRRSAGP